MDGQQLRDVGIERVLQPESPWTDRYRAILCEWFEGRIEGFRFTGETLREVARERGLSEPHHPNAWSGAAASLIREWVRTRKIYVTGVYVLAKSQKTRSHALRQYEKIVARRYRFADPENQIQMEGL